MDTLVHWLNAAVSTLSALNPAWYVVVVGPLAYFVQRALKAEEGFVKAHGTLAAVLFAGGSAAFLALMQAHSVQDFIARTFVVGSPIYTIANLIYQDVKKQLASPSAPTVTITAPNSDTVTIPAPDGV